MYLTSIALTKENTLWWVELNILTQWSSNFLEALEVAVWFLNAKGCGYNGYRAAIIVPPPSSNKSLMHMA